MSGCRFSAEVTYNMRPKHLNMRAILKCHFNEFSRHSLLSIGLLNRMLCLVYIYACTNVCNEHVWM